MKKLNILFCSILFICSSCLLAGCDWFHKHQYLENILVEATCETDGLAVKKCTKCDKQKGDEYVIKATGHSYNVDEVAATCTQSGAKSQQCLYCGKSEILESYPALGHTLTETVVEPTCQAQGYTLIRCANCSYSETTNHTAKVGHKYSHQLVVPTCTTDGYSLHTCDWCGYNFKNLHVDKLGHNYVDGKCKTEGCNSEFKETTSGLKYNYVFSGSNSYAILTGVSDTSLERIRIPEFDPIYYYPVKVIDFEALTMLNIKELYISSNVEVISDEAIGNCRELEFVYLDADSKLTTIGEYNFAACVKLKRFPITEKLSSIGYAAFNGCVELNFVQQTENVANSKYAVLSNGNLYYQITIGNTPGMALALYSPSSTQETFVSGAIDEYIFYTAFSTGNQNLKSVVLTGVVAGFVDYNLNPVYENPFTECENLQEIAVLLDPSIPVPSAFSICEGALVYNNVLISYPRNINKTNVSINDGYVKSGITSIGKNAFYMLNKNVKSLTISKIDTLSSISGNAIAYCNGIESIVLQLNGNGVLNKDSIVRLPYLKTLVLSGFNKIKAGAINYVSFLVTGGLTVKTDASSTDFNNTIAETNWYVDTKLKTTQYFYQVV